jgi:hypothetical protein
MRRKTAAEARSSLSQHPDCAGWVGLLAAKRLTMYLRGVLARTHVVVQVSSDLLPEAEQYSGRIAIVQQQSPRRMRTSGTLSSGNG